MLSKYHLAGVEMIQNKKMLLLTLLIGALVCAAVDVPYMLIGRKDGIALGFFVVFNALMGLTLYTFIFKSLKKTEIVKKIYTAIMVVGSIILLVGIVMIILG